MRAAHARHFAGRETDALALWDSPQQRDAYAWFTTEMANLRAAFRWAADHSDLGLAVDNYEPIAWAEELVEPARVADHPRLAALYVIAARCYTTGRIEAAVRYADAGQTVIASGRYEEAPFGGEGALGAAYMLIGQPEPSVEWCRAQLARGHDTHTLTVTLAIRTYHDAGNTTAVRAALSILAAVFDRLGRYEPEATMAGFAVNPYTAMLAEFNTAIAHLRDVLGDQTCESLARKGETMTTAAMAT